MPETRRLATILALDVAGYSEAAEQDDSAAAEAVRRLRAVIVEIVAPFGGRIFSSAGDGFMLEFHSAIAGVQAAVALLNESRSGERHLPEIRIGIHLGDVIVEENGDLMGHGVNVAARLQALAEPGSAVVSEAVRIQVRSAAELAFTPHGRVQLDKMHERIAVYSLTPGAAPHFAGIARRQAMGAALVVAGIAMIGVLGLAAWALWNRTPSRLVTTVSLYQDGEITPRTVQRITQIGFSAERDAFGRLSIRADFPYRDRLEHQHHIDGLVFNDTPFLPALPKLLIQITNTTTSPISINETQFDVLSAEPDRAALLAVRESATDVRKMIIFNEGWGEATNLRFAVDAWGLPEEASDSVRRVSGAGIESYEPCAHPAQLVRPARQTVAAIADEGGAFVFDLSQRMPHRFDTAPFACAVGILSYRSQGHNVQLALHTRVSTHRPEVSVAPMIAMTYDLYLDPARRNYVAVVPTLQEIAPGRTANIVLTIMSERSSAFILRPSVRTAAGEVIAGAEFNLEVVALRSDATFVLNEARRMAIPAIAIEAEDRGDWIENGSYDPQGREPVRFNARRGASQTACHTFLDDIAPRILRRAGVAQMRAEIARSGEVLCKTRDN